MTDTPLSEADPRSLNDLLASDPFGFSRQDRNRIVAELRRARAAWVQAEMKGAKKAPKSSKPTMTMEDL